ncbi:MAG TPA: ABC transporter ATP-binding protein [Caulobacteraceae bacterium]|nr:ABC transporter ATP-binding protein [Caulobacteraceae bacterium]
MSARAVLGRYLAPEARRVAALAAFMLAAIAMQLVSPPIMRRFIDTAVSGGRHAPLAVLWALAGLFIAAAITQQLLQIGATYSSAQLAWAATNRMRRDLATHVLYLDMSYHTATSPGDIIERVDGDVAALANFFSQFVLVIVGGLLTLVGIVVVLCIGVDWRIGAEMAVVAILAGFQLHAMRNVSRDQWERFRNAFSAFSAFLEERLAGLDDVRANSGGEHVMRRFAELNTELAVTNIEANRRGPWIFLLAVGLFALGFAIALALGAWLYLHHAISIGTVIMAMQLAGMMQQPVMQIGGQVQQFQTASASLTRIRGLLAIGPQLHDGPGLDWEGARTIAPKLAFERVDFAYRADAPVLHDVSIEVKPGEVLGLLGRTGSGKTTLTRLLFRLYDPVSGKVALDGEDIREATLAELRGRIGLVTQEVQLFDASVRDNATLFDPSIADERVVEVLTDLGLGNWLARQPRGLETVLAAGAGLSAGEAQLLAFARVFLKDPGLVVLDEASSRLDPASDLLIERALDKLLGGRAGERRTAIIIAHKLSTVGRADRIAILDHGRVLETGARAALEADPDSAFAKLLRAGVEEALA